mmetsp:Transcript_45883/g.55202  ORF Transcript_45883/g.55202 Transcript_45883/m.55202 type:complete len:208 (-) Transcript_45883:1084-1707(-)
MAPMVVLDFLGLKVVVTLEDSLVFIFWSLDLVGGKPWGEELEAPLSKRFLTEPARTMPLSVVRVATGGDLMWRSCRIWDCWSPDTELPSADLELPRTGVRSFSLGSWLELREDLDLEYVSYLSVAAPLVAFFLALFPLPLLLVVLRRGLVLLRPCELRLDFSRSSSLLMLRLWYLLLLREEVRVPFDRRELRFRESSVMLSSVKLSS